FTCLAARPDLHSFPTRRSSDLGWIDGRCELGPRALGNRSILAAPRDAAMRDKLNRSIKFREEFRPFAPAVPLEAASRYFEMPPGDRKSTRLKLQSPYDLVCRLL